MQRVFLLSSVAAAALGASSAVAVSEHDAAAYEAFRRQHGRTAKEATDPKEYDRRLQIFAQRRAEVEAQNSRPGASWVAALNEFADFTPEELHSTLGRTRNGGSRAARAASESEASSFLETPLMRRSLASTVDWRKRLTSSTYVRQQGHCGSCWAVSSVGALEMHAELAGHSVKKLSYEQLVDCVPNPRNCGGNGGCKGATPELAFDYVREFGITAAEDYEGYQSGGNGKCRHRTVHVRAGGFEQLPVNKVRPLLHAVSKGPVVVSADASGWHSYHSGVFDGCSRNATINHAVLLVGYGTDEKLGKKYWVIRNSWGPHWGENGFIRLLRHDTDEGEAGHCGTDFDPKQGVGCDGGPPTLPVCGMCGVLSDSSYPKDVTVVAHKRD